MDLTAVETESDVGDGARADSYIPRPGQMVRTRQLEDPSDWSSPMDSARVPDDFGSVASKYSKAESRMSRAFEEDPSAMAEEPIEAKLLTTPVYISDVLQGRELGVDSQYDSFPVEFSGGWKEVLAMDLDWIVGDLARYMWNRTSRTTGDYPATIVQLWRVLDQPWSKEYQGPQRTLLQSHQRYKPVATDPYQARGTTSHGVGLGP